MTCREIGKFVDAGADLRKAVPMYTRLVGVEQRTELGRGVLPKLSNLSWLQALSPDDNVRDGAKAVEHATRACELTHWWDWSCLDALAAAYGATGDFEAAEKWETRAITLAPSNQQHDLHVRLENYRDGKPYREEPIARRMHRVEQDANR